MDVVVVDNLYNASEKALDRVEKITGKKVVFYNADIRDKDAMNDIFEKEPVEAVIHFAGLKAVGESVAKPVEYYENNIAGTLNLVDAMRNHGVKNIIFSSSATVYGDPAFIPITEQCPKGICTNPFQIFLYLFFELVALCEHSAKFGGQAVHLISEGVRRPPLFLLCQRSGRV